MKYPDTYSPVPCDFHDILEDASTRGKSGKIHFWSAAEEVGEAEGKIADIITNPDGEFLVTDKEEKVRLDKVITLYGMPGPAFDEYQAYGNSCMDCFDHGQF